MSYHRGSSSSSTSSSNARQNTTSSSARQSATGFELQVAIEKEAPYGFHYMPDGSLMADSAMASGGGVVAQLPKITSLTIDTSNMPTAQTIRGFKVKGSIGSQFTIRITQEDTIKYYNFVSQTFSNGHTSSNNNLEITLSSKVYSNHIVFPSGGGTYNVILIPSIGTQVENQKATLTSRLSKSSSDSTLTFKAFTANTNSYATFPTSTSTGALNGSDNFDFNWDITNASTDANGFGLIPTSNFKDLNQIVNLWFFTTTETVDGAVAPADINKGFVVKVDDLTDIGIGSYVSAVSAGSLVGKPIVTKINTSTKDITLSVAQTFANDITLTFRADGLTAINNAIASKMAFDFSETDAVKFNETNKLVKTVRTGSSGTTVNLNGTYGVGHNDTLALISGVGITTASVVSVTASTSAGSMVVSVSQGALTVGTQISFANIVQVFNVFGKIKISSYPSANKTIYLDIDKFLTPGTAS